MQHSEIGGKIIGNSDSNLMKISKEIALTHHEYWDGQGYPLGLKGEEIPIVGRIVAICDVFDALTSERPYKKAWTIQKTMDLIQSSAGKQFDPKLVDLFVGILPQIEEISHKYSDKHNLSDSYATETFVKG